MKDELIKDELKKIEEDKPIKVNPKHQLLNDKIEQWFHNAIRNKGISTESYNSILKSKDALKASLLELIN
jgi:hypothetical protein